MSSSSSSAAAPSTTTTTAAVSTSTEVYELRLSIALENARKGRVPTPKLMDSLSPEDRELVNELLSQAKDSSASIATLAGTAAQPIDLTGVSPVKPAGTNPCALPAKEGKGRDGQVINWAFTIFPQDNFEDGKEGALAEIYGMEPHVRYLVAGYEVCPDTGREHYQGYLQLKKPLRLTQLKKLFHGSIHWEQAIANAGKNYEYCTKTRACDKTPNEEVIELGERPKFDDNGKREKVRWAETKALAISGRVDEVDPQLFICHYGSLRSIQKDYMKRKADIGGPCGFWFYGAAGTGKSYTARQKYPDAYDKAANKWWDGFQDQPFVLIDDVDPNHACLGHYFKIWADRYSFNAEVKGSAFSIRPTAIVVTSQYHPSKIWSDTETLDAILRRFELHYFSDKGIEVTPREVPSITESVARYQQEQARVPGSAPTFVTPVANPPRCDTSAPTLVVNPAPVPFPGPLSSPLSVLTNALPAVAPGPTPPAPAQTTDAQGPLSLSQLNPVPRYGFPSFSGPTTEEPEPKRECSIMDILPMRRSTQGME